MYRNPMNGCSRLHLNPNSTVILVLESKISYGNDSSVTAEFFGKCPKEFFGIHAKIAFVHKTFLNELSSCKQASNIYFTTEMAQVDKEERGNNNKL